MTGAEFLKFLDVRKVPLWLWAAVTLMSGGILFLPAGWIDVLGLLELRSEHRAWFGGAFVLGASALTIKFLIAAYTAASRKVSEWRVAKVRLKQLGRLSPKEKGVLQRYLDQKTKTQYLHVGDGIATSLEASQIIYRAATVSHAGLEFAFNLQPWAWDYLQNHPEVLEGAVLLPPITEHSWMAR